MIKLNDHEITRINLGEQRIQKAILGTEDGSGEIIFEDKSVAPWGTYTTGSGTNTIVHEQGSDEEIAIALERHRAGIVNLYDDPGWQIGAKRKVQLSGIPKYGTHDLTGTTWVFKGRAEDPADKKVVIDLSSVPDYTYPIDGKTHWKIDFQYYKISKSRKKIKKDKKTGKKKFDYKKQWPSGFNGLAKNSALEENTLCFFKIQDSAYNSYKVYHNETKTEGDKTTTVGTWYDPDPYSKAYEIYHYKSPVSGEKSTTLSPYQEIKITGGDDVANPELMAWLKENATCISASSEKEWSVTEDQDPVEVNLVLVDKDCAGFTLTEGSDSGDDEVENQKPIFIVCQEELLPAPGYLLQKSKTEKDPKTKKEKTVYYGSNSGGWDSTIRKNWCNKGYYKALPEGFRKLLKEFKWTHANGTSGAKIVTDTIALPLETHLIDTKTYSTQLEFGSYKHKIPDPRDSSKEIETHVWEYYDLSRCTSSGSNIPVVKYLAGTKFKPMWPAWADLPPLSPIPPALTPEQFDDPEVYQEFLNWYEDKKPIYGYSAGEGYWLASISTKSGAKDFVYIKSVGSPGTAESLKKWYFAPFMII